MTLKELLEDYRQQLLKPSPNNVPETAPLVFYLPESLYDAAVKHNIIHSDNKGFEKIPSMPPVSTGKEYILDYLHPTVKKIISDSRE